MCARHSAGNARRGSTPFSGKVVWITGASSGIGAALALELARRGAKLVLSARRVEALDDVKAACAYPADVHVHPFDMSDLGNLPLQAEHALGLVGHVDYMIHNAGIASRNRVVETTLSVDQRVMATNPRPL
ncbi:MAG: SDR family NAD(P)-dependent oxidoreductase [Gemmatimonadales bacterium]|nr:SDR family NAD(P)-dependent oxidoreductase [Gemmatimonadales bacterium]NIN13548.1 SDR family NAD(P)-dependent oxidoreductase [Gemmatimonadales bacterium]NIN51542.1 SDR family NAD(P)-dependent oxidoreductase [Gemmatimonadales bacterium]NIP09006.1 SDR family NAD(P)-dependent oxidoreductase [Gemmatimonadales bacterium]NIR03784.1 SDR family NAD(P)-dependent oxidoreductase [Gemmatimonadales bacterium]